MDRDKMDSGLKWETLSQRERDWYLKKIEEFKKIAREVQQFNYGLAFGVVLSLLGNLWVTLSYKMVIQDLGPLPILVIFTVVSVAITGLMYSVWKSYKLTKDYLNDQSRIEPILDAYQRQKGKSKIVVPPHAYNA